jgi:hypothetical protein
VVVIHRGSQNAHPPSKEWTVARDLLKKDLKDGRISSDLPSAKEVYEMRNEQSSAMAKIQRQLT